MIKILALVPVFRRPEILRLFLSHMRRDLPDYARVEFLFVASPDDPDFDQVTTLLRGETVTYCRNTPLGAKMNHGVQVAKQMGFDVLMNIGSDNLWTAALWELYRESFEVGEVFFGVNDFHAMNYDTGEFCFVRGYNTGPDDQPAPIGAGRMIARSILPDGDLYRAEWCWGMDGSSMWELWQHGHRPKVIETNGQPVMLNIMSRTNLTQWEELRWRHDANRFDMRQAFGMDSVRIVEPLRDVMEFNDEVCRRSTACGSRRAAFEIVNEEYRSATGAVRFKNYDVFKSAIYKRTK